MPRVAYVCPGAISMAFAPVPAHDGRGCGPWSNSAAVSGQPGTMGVPAGLPEFGDGGLTANGIRLRGGGAGYASGSDTMRAHVWYPSLYWQRQLSGFTLNVPGQGPSIYSDNQMPVPAASAIGRAAVLARPATFLGQRQVAQPAGSKGHPWKNWRARRRKHAR
jgi:hypothetical protein